MSHEAGSSPGRSDAAWDRQLELVEAAIPACSGWTSDVRDLVKAMVVAAGDLGISGLTRADDDAVAVGIQALRQEALILCDSAVVAAAMHGNSQVFNHVGAELNDRVVVVGERSDLLAELTGAIRALAIHPALVIAAPAGFGAAAEAKQALILSGVPYVVVEGTRGGATVAAAAANALIRLAGS